MRLLEIDPLHGEAVWSFAPEEDFFSATRGSNQRLPNGDTLITGSDSGHVFAVDPGGETVWRFANPDVRGGVRQAIWRMTRFERTELPFLEERP